MGLVPVQWPSKLRRLLVAICQQKQQKKHCSLAGLVGVLGNATGHQELCYYDQGGDAVQSRTQRVRMPSVLVWLCVEQ